MKCEDCVEHLGLVKDIESLGKQIDVLWKIVSSLRKLQYMILGAVVVSPFIVAVLTLAISSGKAVFK